MGKAMMKVISRANDLVLANYLDVRGDMRLEYPQRLEDVFALEASEFVKDIVEDCPVPLPTETSIATMKIGRALLDASATGKLVRFDARGNQLPNLPTS